LPSVEGTLSAKPFAHTIAGDLSAPRESRTSGTLCGGVSGSISAPLSGDSNESAESAAIAELGTLISSLGSLSAQAQSLPLSPPTLPGLPQSQGYQPQATDYTQFNDDSN
jgi:hypothetical protein